MTGTACTGNTTTPCHFLTGLLKSTSPPASVLTKASLALKKSFLNWSCEQAGLRFANCPGLVDFFPHYKSNVGEQNVTSLRHISETEGSMVVRLWEDKAHELKSVAASVMCASSLGLDYGRPSSNSHSCQRSLSGVLR